MKQVAGYADYEAAIAALKEKCGRLNNNNYHYEADIQAWIEAGTLYMQEAPDALAFFHDVGTYYDLIYYLPAAPVSAFDLSAPDKPVLISQVFNRESQKLQDAADYWTAQGFAFYKASRHMTLDVSLVPDSPPYTLAATQEDAHAFAGLLQTYFNPYGDGIPTEEDLMQGIREQRVCTWIAEPEGVPAGYMWTSLPIGNHTDNLGISIYPRFRGRSYSRKIIQSFCTWCRDRDVKVMTLWVNQGNTTAERLYETLGYQYTGKQSRQYLYVPDEYKEDQS